MFSYLYLANENYRTFSDAFVPAREGEERTVCPVDQPLRVPDQTCQANMLLANSDSTMYPLSPTR